ncbi:PPK2 family polyphosphate kinase [Undibacterium arcticum]|uniref:PPK2 family polyphosphate kinase n=1 Tax=Undibacterium arcticum TaxID=1762892 RepID=A0ABV7F2F6_9BURK
MNFRKQFRASNKLKLQDQDAAQAPLASDDKDQSKGQDKEHDKQRVVELAAQIAAYQTVFYAERSRKLLVVLQGMDTAGKDGTVSDVFGRINPLGLRTVSFKAPSLVERDHDYLWRIHQQLPVKGEIVLFNRSHYEDVLITRVHQLIDEAECKRRYAQIADFERMQAETGSVILKFFLHISRDEQKERLQDRLDDPDKHWKFDPQDLVERKSWDDYQRAYEQAIRATDADHAPWYVIPADSKTQRNLAIGSVMVETLERMKLAYPAPHPEYAKLRIT